eukprot:2650226-Rhodomonas_salina.1
MLWFYGRNEGCGEGGGGRGGAAALYCTRHRRAAEREREKKRAGEKSRERGGGSMMSRMRSSDQGLAMCLSGRRGEVWVGGEVRCESERVGV